METNDDKAAGKKKKSKLPLIIVGALLLGGGGFGAFKFLGGSNTSAAVADAPEAPQLDEHGKPIPGAAPKKAAVPGKKQVIIRDPSVVNLKKTLGQRYLKIRMGFEFSTPAIEDELKESDAAVSDFINEYLSGCDITQLDSTASRNKLKRELLLGINEILKKGAVEKIYFTEFVVQ